MQQKQITLNNQQEQIMISWYKNDYEGNSILQKIVKKEIKILGGFTMKDEDDFMSLANKVFLDSIIKWNPEKGSFKNYFKSNYNRKLITVLRDSNRFKVGGNGGIQFETSYDDETDPTGIKRYKEKMKFNNKRKITISLDAIDEDGSSLYDFISAGDNISDFINADDNLDDDDCKKFLKSCSRGQRKLIETKINNPDYNMIKLSEVLNIPVQKCREQILDIKRNPNIKLLQKKRMTV